MGIPIIAARMRSSSGWLNAACLVHAILITLLWILHFKFHISVLSGNIWLGLALMWFLWIPIAAFCGLRNLRNWVITEIAALLILLPTYSTIYTFTVWAIWGFAP